jgi:hypothetical protein
MWRSEIGVMKTRDNGEEESENEVNGESNQLA